MVDAVVARKAATFDDFQKFWSDLYKKSGYDFGGIKSIDDYLPKKQGKAHVSVTPDFSEDVAKANSIGVPLFFGGQEFDNGHIQVYTTVGKDGKTTLRMAGKLMPNAEQILTNWLDQQSVEKVAHTPSKADDYEAYTPPPVEHLQLPGLANANNALVAYAITVGSHIKKGDYEWNQSTVNTADTQNSELKSVLKKVKDWADANPLQVYQNSLYGAKFVTMEQQDAWISAAQDMVENFAAVDEAKEKKISVSKLYPDKVPFHAPSYSASAGIDTSGKPKVIEKYNLPDGGGSIEKYSDFNFINTDSNGGVSKMTKADYEAAIAEGGLEKVDLTPEPTDTPDQNALEESVTVSAGTQIVKVTHRKAKFNSGTMDYTTGKVTDGTGSVSGANGSEYLIEFDDVKIQFQHANDVNINSQKSLMRITIEDWQNGGTQQIENALSTLRSMGLELSAADEQDLELLYWRQMYGTLQNRQLNAKFKTVKKTLDSADLSAMSKADEISAYRSAFGDIYGPSSLTKFIEQGGHLPQMSLHATSGGAESIWAGKPYWLHPNAIDMESMKDIYKGRVLVHDVSYGSSGGNTTEFMKNIARVGFHSTEERMRVLGQWLSGASSSADQKKGSSQYMFTRASDSFGAWNIVMEPTATLRMSNYNLSGDQYGNASNKHTSPFDQKEFLSNTSYHEVMVKNGASLMSDFAAIVVPNEAARKELIKFYEDMGITEIRGLPVAERIVANGTDAKKALQKSWQNIIENQKKGIMPWHSE
jgi:hypothetical protein